MNSATATPVEDTLPTRLALLNLGEAIFLCRMTRYTVIGAIEKGELKGFKTSTNQWGNWRIPRASLVLWMNSLGVDLAISEAGTAREGYPPPDFDRVVRANGRAGA